MSPPSSGRSTPLLRSHVDSPTPMPTATAATTPRATQYAPYQIPVNGPLREIQSLIAANRAPGPPPVTAQQKANWPNPAIHHTTDYTTSLRRAKWLPRYCQKLWMTGAKTRRTLGASEVQSSNEERDTPHGQNYSIRDGFGNRFFRRPGTRRVDRDPPRRSPADARDGDREQGGRVHPRPRERPRRPRPTATRPSSSGASSTCSRRSSPAVRSPTR